MTLHSLNDCWRNPSEAERRGLADRGELGLEGCEVHIRSFSRRYRRGRGERYSERLRTELSAALDEAEADLRAGRYADYTPETLPALADDLKREARLQRNHDRS